MLLDVVVYLAFAGFAAAAAEYIEPCEPGVGAPSSSSSSTKPGPTGSTSGITTFKNRNKCMDVDGAKYADGTKVQLWTCNGTGAQNWSMKRGLGQVKITGNGKTFCLDAGTNPKNGSKVKIWTCYSSLQQQRWYLTNDNRLVVDGTSLCLDLPSGNSNDGTQLQVWTCSDNNANQDWSSTLGVSARRRHFGRHHVEDLA